MFKLLVFDLTTGGSSVFVGTRSAINARITAESLFNDGEHHLIMKIVEAK